jgi:hypothetical protein
MNADEIERSLRSWSWATGGWTGAHAIVAIVALVAGVQFNLGTPTLVVLGILTVGTWATAAFAALVFRRTFRLGPGLVSALASVLAGLMILVAGVGPGAVVDGAAHAVAGVGFAVALLRARSALPERPTSAPGVAKSLEARGGPTKS